MTYIVLERLPLYFRSASVSKLMAAFFRRIKTTFLFDELYGSLHIFTSLWTSVSRNATLGGFKWYFAFCRGEGTATDQEAPAVVLILTWKDLSRDSEKRPICDNCEE